MTRTPRSLALALPLITLLAVNAHAQWTCSTVTQRGALDSLGGTFKTKFEDPAINSSGDVAFHARVGNGGRRVLLAENGVGTPEVIVSQGNLTPDGDIYRKFGSTSINDNGDIGFFADLDSGDGVFVREAGGTIVRAARSGQASPTGGTFDRIQAVSRVNDDGDIAFMARVSGGDDGVFFYDKSADDVSTVAAIGDAVALLTFVCDFVKGDTVGLGDSGNAAFQAKTSVICGLGDTTGFWLQDGSDFESVANVGDGTPLPGTSYNKMFGKPHVNASDNVLFRAKVRPADTCDNPEGNLCTDDADCDGTCIGGTNALEPCAMTSDCPDDTSPDAKCVTPTCGGDRCLGGPDIGRPCNDAEDDCSGNECGEPGQSGKALFLYDSSGPSTSSVAAEKDSAPGTGGGTLKTLAPPGGLSDGDEAAFRSKVRSGSAKHGAFVFNGTDTDIVLASDPVPTDEFGLGTVYRKMAEETGFSRDGAWFTYSARVKEFVPNPSNAGLFRCEQTP